VVATDNYILCPRYSFDLSVALKLRMPSKPGQKDINRLKDVALTTEQKQTDAPFKFLVRPVTTVNVSTGKLSNQFEDKVSFFFKDITFVSPISAVLILPTIIDSSIAVPPPDYVGYKKRDNSVSVGINIDFLLWERSSEPEHLCLLADNIRCSLDKIKGRYLVDADREKLRLIVDMVQAQLASRFQN
jgi:hypothetical protein